MIELNSDLVPAAGNLNENPEEVLAIQNLRVHYTVRENFRKKTLKAVNGISLSINAGECLGLVGESGCGKSTLASAIMGLVPITSGSVHVLGHDMAANVRNDPLTQARSVQMVFQDPFASLNPRRTVREALAAPLRLHGMKDKAEIDARVVDMLGKVGMKPDAANRRPHEFSGGQRQRICIARALIVQPKLLVCDEPVSALDVSIRAQIINLLLELKDELGIALLMISHDLGVVEHMSDRIAVMYLGRIVEEGIWSDIFTKPLHPYTQALIASIPDPLAPTAGKRRMRGEAPSPLNPPQGCAFNPRCPSAFVSCRSGDIPAFTNSSDSSFHRARCHLLEQG
ncbi:ATP-binding cassette domain-containing protein [Brucella tritici]|uniref:ABC transporter ATP-binding protein n=1 Tax=Brucella tritici TaxID=94626 RepID=UPI00124DF7E0|nr:oligopeptide/dipeptide ABC transporter ATP-binding protein [Brucella tritici]KAB2675751.1 ATP-binding cassette domain-containing protein [Brucella tritici]MBJ6719115.1 ATP-binding cassette domain-containing protein [Bacillus sp. PR5]